MRDSRGLVYSTTLHGILLLLLLLGLPDFFKPNIDAEPESISVDILPIAPVSNIKPQEKSVPVEDKKPVAETHVEKKAVQETKKDEPKPEEKPEIIPTKKIPIKVEKKKEEKPKKEEKKADDLDAILKSVKNEAKSEEGKKPTQQKATPDTHEAKSQNYDSSQPLSMSQKDAIRSQVEVHWVPPLGAKDAQNLIVTLRIEVSQDGTVMKAELAHDQGRYNSDSFFRAAVDSAIRAVNQASPFKNLPADKYGTWRDMEMSFNPKDAL